MSRHNGYATRLDEHGLSIPDSLWMQMRDSVLKVFIEMQKE